MIEKIFIKQIKKTLKAGNTRIELDNCRLLDDGNFQFTLGNRENHSFFTLLLIHPDANILDKGWHKFGEENFYYSLANAIPYASNVTLELEETKRGISGKLIGVFPELGKVNIDLFNGKMKQLAAIPNALYDFIQPLLEKPETTSQKLK